MTAKAYRRESLSGALGAFLMLVGDLCLSVIPASPGDSGLFAREAYLNGSWDAWRLPLLIAAGLCGRRSARKFRRGILSSVRRPATRRCACGCSQMPSGRAGRKAQRF